MKRRFVILTIMLLTFAPAAFANEGNGEGEGTILSRAAENGTYCSRAGGKARRTLASSGEVAESARDRITVGNTEGGQSKGQAEMQAPGSG